MKAAYLIKMANQIGAFFDAMPNREQAVKDVAAHMQRNWEPRMRVTLQQYVSQSGDAELSSIVREALPLVK
jgi:formate dehydrogenase subunit delta